MKIYNPLRGQLVSIEEVPDPVFSQKMMGDGVAIKPTSNKVVSPVKGKLSSVFPTKHAFGIVSEEGVEILIHIGVDTVDLKGEYFDLKVEQGQEVEIGDTLVEVDFALVEKAGFPIITPVVILDKGPYNEVLYDTDKEVEYLDGLMELK